MSPSPQSARDKVDARISQTSLAAPAQEQRLEHASVHSLAEVFPQYICSAIRKTGAGAAVTMSFPYYQQGSIYCLMSLSILPSKLEFLAMRLFGVHLDTDGEMRFVVHGTAKIYPRPEMSIQGARRAAILEVLGPMTDAAVAASPIRREEARQAVQDTSCAALSFHSDALHDGLLSLNLGLDDGFRIKDKLYEQAAYIANQ